MALARIVGVDLLKTPPEDDEHADLPNVKGALESFVKWAAVAGVGAWDGVSVIGPPPFSPETLVDIGEVAARGRGDFTTATGALSLFFSRDPPKNQYFCRALLVRSLIESDAASRLSGQDAVHQNQRAIATVLECLQITLKDENKQRYAFLTYSASVHHWWVCRPFFKDGGRRFAIPSLTRIVEALEAVGEPDTRWRARNWLTLAQCCDEASLPDKAAAAVAKALECVKGSSGPDVPALLEDTRRMNIHVARRDVAKALPPAKDEAKGALRSKVLAELQTYLSGFAPVKGAAAEGPLLALVHEVSPSTKQLYDMRSAPTGGAGSAVGSPGSDVADAEVLAVIARVAASNDLFALAEVCVECTVRAKGGASPTAKVLADLASADVTSRQCTPAQVIAAVEGGEDRRPGAKKTKEVPRIDGAMVARAIATRRVDAIKLADRALQNAQSIGNSQLIEECASLVWNLALPLLQPDTRATAYRPMFNAARALQAIASQKVLLRAQLHYEIARCELAKDFLVKAAEHLTSALALDYGGSGKEPEEVTAGVVDSSLRPLDRFMQPLLAQLKLRSSLYDDPNHHLDQATLLLQQATDAMDSQVSVTLLERVVKRLVAAAEADPRLSAIAGGLNEDPLAVVDSGTLVPGENGGVEGKRFVNMWADVVKLAAKHRATALVKKGCAVLRRLSWRLESNRELILLLADIDLGLVEALALDVASTELLDDEEEELPEDEGKEDDSSKLLAAENDALMSVASGGTSLDAARAEAVRRDPRAMGAVTTLLIPDEETSGRLNAVKELAISACVSCANRAVTLSADWIAERAFVTLLNTHLAVAQSNSWHLALPSLRPAFTACLDALFTTQCKNGEVLTSAAIAVAAAAEVTALLAAAQGDKAKAGAEFDAACATAARVLDTPSPVLKSILRPLLLRPLISLAARARLSKQALTTPALTAAPGLAVPSAATSPLHKAFCFDAVCRHASVEAKEKKAALEQWAKLMPETPAAAEPVKPGGVKSPVKGAAAPAPAKKGTAPVADEPAVIRTEAEAAAEATRLKEEGLAMFAELWARLARCALDIADLRTAQSAACSAVALIPESGAAREAVGPLLWRWVALAECLWSQAVAALVNPDTQDKPTQDDISTTAVRHAGAAARWAAIAKDPVLALTIARSLYNVSLPLAGSSSTRPALTQSLRACLQALAECGEATDYELRVQLYRLMFQSIVDVKNWSYGLELAEEAFQVLPANHANSLWPDRVLFMSRLGQDVRVGLAQLKESSPKLQAKLWLTLARSSGLPVDQLTAFHTAIGLLEGMITQAAARTELGEWLYANRFPVQDATEQLYAAADMLTELIHPSIEDVPSGGEGSSMFSKSQSQAQTRSKAGSSRGGSVKGTKSAGTRSVSGSTVAPPASAASKGSRVSSIAPGKSLDADPDWPSRVEIRHFEALVRVWVNLGRMAGSWSERTKCALLAAYYVEQMWALTIHAVNTAAAERTYFGLGEAQRALIDSYDEWLFVQTKDGPHRCPQTASEWLAYSPTDSLLAGIQSLLGLHAPYALKAGSLEHPLLFLEHLQSVVETLTSSGHTGALRPVFLIAQHVAATCVNPPARDLVCLWHHWAGRWWEDANQAANAAVSRSVGGPFALDEADVKHYRQDVAVMEAHKKRMAEEDVVTTGRVKGATTAAGAKRLALLQSSGAAVGGMEPIGSIQVSLTLPIRKVWARLAEVAVESGEFVAAKRYITEVLKHCRAYDDDSTAWHCQLLSAWMLFLEGEYKQAVNTVLTAQSTLSTSDSGVWFKALSAVASFLSRARRNADAVTVLKQAIQAFDTAAQPMVVSTSSISAGGPALLPDTKQPDMDAVVTGALLRVELGAVLTQTGVSLRRAVSPWSPSWEEADAAFTSAVTALLSVDAVPLAVSALVRHAECVLALPAADPYLYPTKPLTTLTPDDQSALANQRMQWLRNALALLKHANELCGPWLAQTHVREGPEGWSSPASRLAADVKLRQCVVELAIREEESAVGEEQAALLRSRLAADPLRFFLHTEATSGDTAAQKALARERAGRAAAEAASGEVIVRGLGARAAAAQAFLGAAVVCLAQVGEEVLWRALPPTPPPEVVVEVVDPKAKGKPAPKAAPKKAAAKPAGGKGKGAAATAVVVPADPLLALQPVVLPLGLHDTAVQGLSQAQSLLLQAAVTSASVGDTSVLARCSAQLLECYGTAFPCRATAALVTLQSCVAQEELLRIADIAAEPSNRLMLFRRQLEYLSAKRPVGAESLAHVQRLKKFLSSRSRLWDLVQVSSPFSHVVKALPASLRVLVLQRSASGNAVYVSAFRRRPAVPEDPPAFLACAPTTGADGSTDDAVAVCGIARVRLSQQDRASLCELLRDVRLYHAAANKALASCSDESGPGLDTQAPEGAGEEKGDAYGQATRAVPELNGIFGDLAGRLNALMGPWLADVSVQELLAGPEPVLLLPDPVLARLPLESLSVLEGKSSVSRDFSLHFLAARTKAARYADPDFVPSLDAEDPNSDSLVPSLSLPALSFVADPTDEDKRILPEGSAAPEAKAVAKSPAKSPVKGAAPAAAMAPATRLGTPKRATCAETASEASSSIGATAVVLGSDHTPSGGEWQGLLCTPGASGHVFVGPGTLLSSLPPALLVGLDTAPTCKLALLCDRGVTPAGVRRAARLSAGKPVEESSLELGYETAALVSMTGAGAVVCNQWPTSCSANDQLARGVLSSLATTGGERPVTLGEAVRTAFSSPDVVYQPRVKLNPVVYGLAQLSS